MLGTARLAAGSDRALLVQHLPDVDDEGVREAFADRWTLWYTDAEMPPAYQHDTQVNGNTTFHTPRYDISGGLDYRGKGGNGNNEFPWFKPGGTDRSRVRTLRGLSLPAVNGQRLPVVCYPDVKISRRAPHRKPRLSWRFPEGARLFEVLYLDRPDGTPRAFEVRMRRRMATTWDTAVFRPVPTRDDLFARFEFGPQPAWRDRVVASHRHEIAFDLTAGWEVLPLLRPEDVDRLLSQPFTDATGVPWSDIAAAPTSVQDYSLVPRNYDGTLVGTDPVSCARCHEHVGRHVANFEDTRDWYGFIRGSDGIFSFLPVHPSSVSRSGESRPVRLHPGLVASGYVTTAPQAPASAPYLPLESPYVN